MHYAACEKVAGSIPDEVIGFFNDLSLQLYYGPRVDPAFNRNVYQESSGAKGLLALKADNLTAISELIV
jgi:hypothetical protein